MPGPNPNMHALVRERDWKTFTRLPRECSIPVPDWPLEVPDPTVAELSMWERYWKMPQAHVWHADHAQDQVALYVRVYLEAAKRGASAILRTEVRQKAATLLLDTNSLNSARYLIVDSPEDQVLKEVIEREGTGTDGATGRQAGPAHPGPRRASTRGRLRVAGGTGPAEPTQQDDEDEADPDA